jgi:hypothetical protein
LTLLKPRFHHRHSIPLLEIEMRERGEMVHPDLHLYPLVDELHHTYLSAVNNLAKLLATTEAYVSQCVLRLDLNMLLNDFCRLIDPLSWYHRLAQYAPSFTTPDAVLPLQLPNPVAPAISEPDLPGIHLLVQYFAPVDLHRRREIELTLLRNIQNPHFQKIHLLQEQALELENLMRFGVSLFVLTSQFFF